MRMKQLLIIAIIGTTSTLFAKTCVLPIYKIHNDIQKMDFSKCYSKPKSIKKSVETVIPHPIKSVKNIEVSKSTQIQKRIKKVIPIDTKKVVSTQTRKKNIYKKFNDLQSLADYLVKNFKHLDYKAKLHYGKEIVALCQKDTSREWDIDSITSVFGKGKYTAMDIRELLAELKED